MGVGEEEEEFVLRADVGDLLRGTGEGEECCGVSTAAIIEFDGSNIIAGKKENVLVVLGPLDAVYHIRESPDIEAIVLLSDGLNVPFSREEGEHFPIGPVEQFLSVVGKLHSFRIARELFEPLAGFSSIEEEEISALLVKESNSCFVVGDEGKRRVVDCRKAFRWRGGELFFVCGVSNGELVQNACSWFECYEHISDAVIGFDIFRQNDFLEWRIERKVEECCAGKKKQCVGTRVPSYLSGVGDVHDIFDIGCRVCVDVDEKRVFFSGLSRQEGDKERIGISRRPSESVFRRTCAYGEIGCAEYLFLRIGGCVECGHGCFSGVFRDDGDATLLEQREKRPTVFK